MNASMQGKYVIMAVAVGGKDGCAYNGSPNSNSLSAASNRIRDIFNISAGEILPRGRDQTNSNAEFGIGT